MSISRRVRFEIFRRDGHACRYCGRRPPAVTLEVDHRIPRCMGGTDDPENLVAACWDCNRGKGPLPFEGSRPEGWDGVEHHWLSWQHWMEEWGACDQPDELPWWLTRRRDRSVLRFDFDIYQAASDLAPAQMVYADTLDSVLRRAEAFT